MGNASSLVEDSAADEVTFWGRGGVRTYCSINSVSGRVAHIHGHLAHQSLFWGFVLIPNFMRGKIHKICEN